MAPPSGFWLPLLLNPGDGPGPIAFFSKSFSPAQCKYSTFSRELLGLYLAVEHFRHYFEGNSDTILYCDHEPLVKAFYSSNQRDNARECCHLSEIASFCTNLRFIKGCDNIVADALSCIEINSIFQCAAKIDWHALAKAQRNDNELNVIWTKRTPPTSSNMSGTVQLCFVTFHVMAPHIHWYHIVFAALFLTTAMI